jgi:hypothetical protein
MQNDQVRREFSGLRHGLTTILSLPADHKIALRIKKTTKDSALFRVVIHNQYVRHENSSWLSQLGESRHTIRINVLRGAVAPLKRNAGNGKRELSSIN